MHIDELKERFKSDQSLVISDILDFYQSFEPNVIKTTVNWRIYNLVQQGVLTRTGRGIFTFGKESVYIPEISEKIKSLNKKLKRDFPYLSICIWSTSILNEFMLHQPGRFYTLVEVEKDALESIFFYMKDKKYTVYMKPSRELFNKYVSDEKESWIIKPLVSEAPTQSITGVSTVTIEKILVDIFCDPITFEAQQGSEMDQIFMEAFEKYTVSESKILRYANRRRKKKNLNNYLNQVSKYRQHM